ncbi:MAG: UpxY family transcription antiterminator [Planctomycetota bacterium]
MEVFCDDTKSDDLKWYAVRTYSFRERIVARLFAAQGICHYLPLLMEKHRWSDRLKTVKIPLFKNYLFVKITPIKEDFWKVISTRGVTRILGDERGPISIPREEIEAVAFMLATNAHLEVVRGLHDGQPVRIKAGPFRGIEGYFVQVKGKDRLACHIHILGQTMLAEVNCCDVEPR